MLEIYMLGKSAFIQNGKALTFRTRKAEALLHYLVIIARPADRTTLAEIFWPDMTTTNAQKNLRATLPDLRHVLGEYLIVSHQEIAALDALPVGGPRACDKSGDVHDGHD